MVRVWFELEGRECEGFGLSLSGLSGGRGESGQVEKKHWCTIFTPVKCLIN
jgi:hypothetical protein